ncbi:hypothetical protein HK102_002227 [Quaeritorhiza haematococci]|nr:hypothetical protein HK102_002227 [Quaeritorhiza haematococci]
MLKSYGGGVVTDRIILDPPNAVVSFPVAFKYFRAKMVDPSVGTFLTSIPLAAAASSPADSETNVGKVMGGRKGNERTWESMQLTDLSFIRGQAGTAKTPCLWTGNLKVEGPVYRTVLNLNVVFNLLSFPLSMFECEGSSSDLTYPVRFVALPSELSVVVTMALEKASSGLSFKPRQTEHAKNGLKRSCTSSPSSIFPSEKGNFDIKGFIPLHHLQSDWCSHDEAKFNDAFLCLPPVSSSSKRSEEEEGMKAFGDLLVQMEQYRAAVILEVSVMIEDQDDLGSSSSDLDNVNQTDESLSSSRRQSDTLSSSSSSTREGEGEEDDNENPFRADGTPSSSSFSSSGVDLMGEVVESVRVRLREVKRLAAMAPLVSGGACMRLMRPQITLEEMESLVASLEGSGESDVQLMIFRDHSAPSSDFDRSVIDRWYTQSIEPDVVSFFFPRNRRTPHKGLDTRFVLDDEDLDQGSLAQTRSINNDDIRRYSLGVWDPAVQKKRTPRFVLRDEDIHALPRAVALKLGVASSSSSSSNLTSSRYRKAGGSGMDAGRIGMIASKGDDVICVENDRERQGMEEGMEEPRVGVDDGVGEEVGVEENVDAEDWVDQVLQPCETPHQLLETFRKCYFEVLYAKKVTILFDFLAKRMLLPIPRLEEKYRNWLPQYLDDFRLQKEQDLKKRMKENPRRMSNGGGHGDEDECVDAVVFGDCDVAVEVCEDGVKGEGSTPKEDGHFDEVEQVMIKVWIERCCGGGKRVGFRKGVRRPSGDLDAINEDSGDGTEDEGGFDGTDDTFEWWNVSGESFAGHIEKLKIREAQLQLILILECLRVRHLTDRHPLPEIDLLSDPTASNTSNNLSITPADTQTLDGLPIAAPTATIDPLVNLALNLPPGMHDLNLLRYGLGVGLGGKKRGKRRRDEEKGEEDGKEEAGGAAGKRGKSKKKRRRRDPFAGVIEGGIGVDGESVDADGDAPNTLVNAPVAVGMYTSAASGSVPNDQQQQDNNCPPPTEEERQHLLVVIFRKAAKELVERLCIWHAVEFGHDEYGGYDDDELDPCFEYGAAAVKDGKGAHDADEDEGEGAKNKFLKLFMECLIMDWLVCWACEGNM